MIIIKNISINPTCITNKGKTYLNVKCLVFTKNDFASIKSVWLDLYHTSLFKIHKLESDISNMLLPSGEGYYYTTIEIPALIDTGTYHLPIVAVDSKGAKGRYFGSFIVNYERNPYLKYFSNPEFHKGFENISNQKFTSNNYIEVLDDGENALKKRLELIESATKQINLQTYTLGHIGAGGKILDALLKKCDQGVEINIILNADTQIPTSPISTIKLKLNQLVDDWAKDDETGIIEWLSKEFLYKKFGIDKKRKINLLLFDAEVLKDDDTSTISDKKQTDHWLEKIVKEGIPKLSEYTKPGNWKAYFQGPGGLPAFPLLDYAIHEKIMVVDGQKAIVGGRNLEDKYYTTWIDLDLYLEGQIVNDIQKGFLNSFKEISNKKNHDLLPEKLLCAQEHDKGIKSIFIQSRPWKREYNTLNALVYAIQTCTKRLYIRSQYIVLPDSLLRDAILDARKRNVDVRILTNSYKTSQKLNFGSGWFVTLNYLESLLDAGIKIFIYKGIEDENAPQPYNHIKEFIFDGKICAIGSFNLSLRSCYIESENLIFIDDRKFSVTREAYFLSKLETDMIEVTKEYYQKQKTLHKAKMEIVQVIDLLF